MPTVPTSVVRAPMFEAVDTEFDTDRAEEKLNNWARQDSNLRPMDYESEPHPVPCQKLVKIGDFLGFSGFFLILGANPCFWVINGGWCVKLQGLGDIGKINASKNVEK